MIGVVLIFHIYYIQFKTIVNTYLVYYKYIHPLLMVVILKPSGGDNFWLEIHHTAYGFLINKT